MAVERWTEYYEGQSWTFECEMIGEYALECPHCGNYCSGYYLLWIERDDGTQALRLDGFRLSELFGALIGRVQDYIKLPELIRHWNEITGWADDSKPGGSVIDPKEMIGIMDLMLSGPLSDPDALFDEFVPGEGFYFKQDLLMVEHIRRVAVECSERSWEMRLSHE